MKPLTVAQLDALTLLENEKQPVHLWETGVAPVTISSLHKLGFVGAFPMEHDEKLFTGWHITSAGKAALRNADRPVGV